MGPLGCPETSVTNCHSTLHKIPEEQKISKYQFIIRASRKKKFITKVMQAEDIV